MRIKEADFITPCNCRTVDECNHNLFAWKLALDAVVDAFAKEMKRKLTLKFMQGYSGWDSPDWPEEEILIDIKKHVEKGDMVDVANLAMFLWNKKP